MKPFKTVSAFGRRTDSPRDRKSTRLNSSHLVISYAVFCLKKKNQVVYVSSSPGLTRSARRQMIHTMEDLHRKYVTSPLHPSCVTDISRTQSTSALRT